MMEKKVSLEFHVIGSVKRKVSTGIEIAGSVLRQVGTNVNLTGELDKAKTIGLLELLFDDEEV